jgi:uroporphyrinogen-III synthase
MEATTVKPLTGLTVLVTRPVPQAQTLSDKLRALGAIPIELPTVEITPPESYSQLDNAIVQSAMYDWIIFTSVHGAQSFLDRLRSLNFTIRILDGIKVAAVGPATATALANGGREPDYVPERYLTESIASGLGDVRGRRILLPRADVASKRLPEILRALGATVNEIVAYRTVKPRNLTSEKLGSILADRMDLVTFTSPSTVRNLVQTLAPEDFTKLSKCKVACIGPVTVQAATELGVHVDIVAENHTIDSLVEAIVNEIRPR